ncbi:hypothetical protein AAG906_016050 [Vitis piasezkii]
MAYNKLLRLGLVGVTTLLVYKDNIVVTGLKYFLGIEVAHSRHGIFISQQYANRAYVVGVVSQFMHNPKVHLDLGMEVLFKRSNELKLETYMDADYAGSIDERRLTSGYCTFLEGNLVTWKNKK